MGDDGSQRGRAVVVPRVASPAVVGEESHTPPPVIVTSILLLHVHSHVASTALRQIRQACSYTTSYTAPPIQPHLAGVMAAAAPLLHVLLLLLTLAAVLSHGSHGHLTGDDIITGHRLHKPSFPSSSPLVTTHLTLIDPSTVWQLPAPDVKNDTAGYPVIPPTRIVHSVLFTANSSSPSFPGTFNHHPHVFVANSTSPLLLLSFSNGVHTEDADGQQVLYLTSPDAGLTFSPITILFPPALLPRQPPSPFNTSSLQRALCSEGFLQLPDGRVFALAELFGYSNVTAVKGEGSGWKATGFGRVARPVSATDGRPLGPPCWVQPSRFAGALVGTPYDVTALPLCEDSDVLVRLLSSASLQPAWSWAALSEGHYVHADSAASQVQEPTHAAVFASSELCRFWRLVSASSHRTLYMQCANTTDTQYNLWWNATDETATGWAGPFADLVPSNIPDAGSKEYLTTLPPPFTHLLVSNLKPNGDRWPLTVATSTDNATFSAIYALHSSRPPPARYSGGNVGYQYPTAAVQHRLTASGTDDGRLFIVYNVNKEDIHLSQIQLRDLPRHSPAAVPTPLPHLSAPSTQRVL